VLLQVQMACLARATALCLALTLEQFTAMMRSGVKPDGRPFPATMPWENASNMNDDDLAALYTYLTSQP
jgi:hypothetical protein